MVKTDLFETCMMNGWTAVDYNDAIERCRVRADLGYDPCGVLREEFNLDDPDLAVELLKTVKGDKRWKTRNSN